MNRLSSPPKGRSRETSANRQSYLVEVLQFGASLKERKTRIRCLIRSGRKPVPTATRSALPLRPDRPTIYLASAQMSSNTRFMSILYAWYYQRNISSPMKSPGDRHVILHLTYLLPGRSPSCPSGKEVGGGRDRRRIPSGGTGMWGHSGGCLPARPCSETVSQTEG